MADALTIQTVHDDLITQLDHGSVAVLWSRNLPSQRLWTLVAATLSNDPANPVTQIVLSPPDALNPVRVSPVAGEAFTVTGQVDLLNLVVTTTVTVTVRNGEPDLAFILTPSARWTLGQSFEAFNNRLFDQWCGQLTGKKLTWSSVGSTAGTALALDASLLYSGVYSVINILYSGQVAQHFTQPIAFGTYGPTFSAQIPVVHTGNGALAIGPVNVDTPYFVTRLTYVPSDDDETQMSPATTVGLGWHLDSHNQAVNDFEIIAVITGNYPVLTVSGGYPDDDNALALTDIVAAMYGSAISPPSLPGPLQFLATDVGLQRFSVSVGLTVPPAFRAAQIYIATKPTSPGWVIIGPASDPLLALQEIHFRYSTLAADILTVNSVLLGGTIKIGSLLFMADASYTWSGADYVIEGRGELVTADGLPLRFSDLIAGFGAPSVAAAFDDFLELSFSLIGAELTYENQGGTVTTRWSAYADADLKLKLFGQEFLGLHNATVNVGGVEVGGGPPSYVITASGQIFVLGIVLPAELVLSDGTKTFRIGPISFTLGDIITWMVNIIHPSWNYELPEPWNVLNSIGFENLTLEFDFENQTVTLDTGLTADFGFISLTSIRLTYYKRVPSSGKQGVVFAMKGKFLGLPIEVTTDDPDLEHDEMGWDLVNGKPIEVPGAGDELFRLDYLGIGQHVAFRDTRDLRTVGEVITALENNLKPVAGDSGNPLATQNGLVFAENSGWLLGSKFSVLSTVTISVIFNDPQLYGLRIALQGEKAQSLSGLEFEILYKRISDTIGLYHIDLRLPDAIRQLEFGEVSVTIPEFVLDIYTNGNFKIDVGFPYRLDFSRSFSVEVFPFVGFGGFYFGYLEGATSDRVPTVSDGTFKPVLEFGLGLSIGVGKTIEKGILRAGATLTVEGIVEGVLAWFNPDDANRDTALFYSIAGTVGIEGHVYGAIDFKIVKASVDIRASARVTVIIECYQPIDIALNVSVSARVSVKILFITIHCSFSIDLNLEYTIGHATTPPWTIDTRGTRQQFGLVQRRHGLSPNEFGRLRASRAKRLQRARRAPKFDLAAVDRMSLHATRDVEQTVIALQFRPFFTQSDQPSLVNDQPPPAGERVRSVAMLYTATAGSGPDTVFAQLASLCFQRVVAAQLATKPDENDRVSLYDLSVIKHQLDLGLHDPDFAYDALVAFFVAAGIVFDISGEPQNGAVTATFFPMIPALTLTDTLTDGAGGQQHFVSVNYATDPRLMVDETYEGIVDSYFRAFQAGSENLVEQLAAGISPEAAPRAGTTESMAQYVFRDYFLMITQSMVQSAIDYLDAYPYVVPQGAAQSLTAIASAMSAQNDPHDENPAPLSIALANVTATDILDAAGTTATGIAGAFYQANNGESLNDIAGRFSVSATALAAMVNPDFGVANAAGPNMINPGIQIDLGDIVYTCADTSMTLGLVALLFAVPPDSIQNDPGNAGLDFAVPFPPGTQVHVPAAHYVLQPTDTLAGLAQAFQTALSTIVTRNADLKTLVRPLGIWAIPIFFHTWQSGDSLQSIAQAYALTVAQLLEGGYAAAPIIKAGAALTIPYRPDIPAADLYAAMGATTVTGPVANSVSRFMMHGMRLPQISPLTFDSMKPMYINLGQQIDVPNALLTETGYSYALTLAADPRPQWITFNGGTGISGSYDYAAEDLTELGVYNAVFTPDQLTVRQLPLMAYTPNRYPLRQVVHWQSPHGLAPVTGEASNGNGEPNIWNFPPALMERLSAATGGTDAATTLKFAIAIGRQPAPNAPPVYTPVGSFAWGTVIDLGVKRVMAGSAGNIAVKNDYLLSGIDPASREALYRLWTYMADPSYADQADLYVLCRADPASQSGRGVISQDLVTASTAVLKTNLSTVNNPAPSGTRLRAAAEGDPAPVYAATIGQPRDFLRLIWESVTVNSGGYYLNYTENGTGDGLPDDLFDTNGVATVQILVIFASQRHSGNTLAGQPPMLRMSNCVVLSDHLDLGNAELVVEGANYTVEAGTSLAAVEAAMGFASMADFVSANQALKVLLRQGLTIAVGSGTIVEVGDSLLSIAARVGANPLAVANAVANDTSALIPGALCQYAPGQMRLIGTGAVGSVGLEVTRADPDPDDVSYATLTAQQKLDLMFNLLGIDLTGNGWFQPLAMTTDTGQPAGRANEWPATGPLLPDDVPPALRATNWVYRKLVPYYEFAVPAANAALDAPHLPPRNENPYAGIAPSSQIALEVHFQDNFGNRPAGAGASGSIALPAGYRDLIQPLSAWPGVATSYLVNKVNPQPGGGVYKVGIEIDAGFRTANYSSGAGQTVTQARKRIAADQEKLRQIYYQIVQPDMQMTMTTTLDSVGDVPALYSLSKSSFVDIVNAGLLFFGQQLETAQVTTAGVAGDTIASMAARWLLVDPGALPKANAAMTLGSFFDLAAAGQLTLPVTILARAGQSLVNLARSATDAMGQAVNEQQVATLNADVPLKAGTTVVAPERTIPGTNDPAIGDQSLAQLAERYAATVTSLAAANATDTTVLRPGTMLTLEGVDYAVAAGDSFAGLVTAFEQVPVAVGRDTFRILAEARGLSVGALAFANETAVSILAAGGTFTYPDGAGGTVSTQVVAGDSLYTVANKIASQLRQAAVTVESLVTANQDIPGLLKTDAVLATGLTRIRIDVIANANANVTALFVASAHLKIAAYRLQPGDTVTSVVAAFTAIDPSYTLSRFVSDNGTTGDLMPAGAQLLAGTRTQSVDAAETLADFADASGLTFTQIGQYNSDKPLAVTTDAKYLVPERTTAAGLSFSAVQPAAGESLVTVASRFAGITAGNLAEANAQMWRTLTPGLTVSLNGTTVITTANMTFAALWIASGGGTTVDYAALAAAIDAASALRAGAVLVGPPARAGSAAARPTDLAAAWNIDADDLLTVNRAAAAFLNPGATVTFVGTAGPVVLTVRPNDTINTFHDYAIGTAGLEAVDRTAYFAALAMAPALIAAQAAFVVPPTIERITTRIDRNFPSKLFRLTQAVQFARVNYEVTAATITALEAVPDITAAQATKLNAMASAGQLYIDGDAFDAALRLAFGSEPDIDYLISMTRRYAMLPTVQMDPSFADVPAALSVETQIPAHATPNSPEDTAQSLRNFAVMFEAAFDNAVKVSISAAGDALGPSQAPRQLWAVDFSQAGYGFRVDGSQPSYFARQPISNKLLAENGVSMRYYVSGNPAPVLGDPIDVKHADLDIWARQFFETVDLALSPECAVSIYQHAPTALDSLVALKGRLAETAAGQLGQLIDNGHPGNLTLARESFAERLKIELADAYRIETVLQFPVAITNGGPERAGIEPPRLFGQPVNLSYVTATVETIASLGAVLGVSQPYVVEMFAGMPGILNLGPGSSHPITVTYTPTGATAQPTASDSLTTLAIRLGIAGSRPAQALIGAITISPAGEGLFAPQVSLSAIQVSYVPAVATSIEAVAQVLDVSVLQLAAAMQDTAGLFNPAITSLTWLYGTNATATVPLAATSTFNTLAAAFAAAGVTPAPDAAAVANYFRILPPDLIAAGARLSIVELIPNSSFNATAVPLSASGSVLTFFLDVANPSRARKLFMDLDFPINQIEHDIAAVPADPDYENSAWLSFLLPFDTAGGSTDSRIGMVDIPIPNLSYPDSPVLTGQAGVPTPRPEPPVTVMDFKKWDYNFAFEYRVAAQDLIYTGVTINRVAGAGSERRLRALDEDPGLPTNILEALAQFNASYQSLTEDLQQLPFLSADDTGNPAVASASVLAEFGRQIEQLWTVLPPAPGVGGQDGEHGYVFTMTRARDAADYLDTLIMTAQKSGETLWPGRAEVQTPDGTWYQLTRLTPNPTVEVVFAYPQDEIRADTTLTHRIWFIGLDVVVEQSARAGVHVTRNENLSNAGATLPAFVYRTPVIATADDLTPLIGRADPYVLPPPSAPNNDLVNALSNFFKELFDIGSITWASGTTRMITLHVAYRFDLAPGQPLGGSDLTPQAPSVLHTQYAFRLNPATGSPDYQPVSDTFVSNLAAAVNSWTSANLDPGQPGYLVFDLMVLADDATAADAPNPVLKLTTLLWALQ
ncbi:LysM peptidoglycan-binding domain-containing protein [Rhizobium terrae]|uniref:LysM peptidoglycan-binding domain-containing protein n=1 Tax=Rhizobium terrae TaxID=2171756 RepID=UPI000E3D4F72|nr:LysM domain-containing protein [Rhizobium terrae]